MKAGRAAGRALRLALLLPSPAAAQELAAEVSVERPRDFGWRVGDLLPLAVRVRVPAGFEADVEALEARDLPEWLEERESGWRAEEAGGWRTYTFRFEYQLFHVPDGVTRLAIPAVDLAFHGGQGRAVVAAIPAFAFAVSPLTDSTTAAAPDWRPAPPSPRGLRAGGALLGALLLAWGGGSLAERRRRRAGALWRARRRIARAEDCGEALLILHRALEERAGRAVFGHELERLVREWPAAAAVRAELEEFFALSRSRFFDGGPGPPAAEHGEEECRRRISRLAARLAEIEGRTGSGAG